MVEQAVQERGGDHVVAEDLAPLLALQDVLQLVVLAVGMIPRGIDDLVKMLKVSRGNDRFLLAQRGPRRGERSFVDQNLGSQRLDVGAGDRPFGPNRLGIGQAAPGIGQRGFALSDFGL